MHVPCMEKMKMALYPTHRKVLALNMLILFLSLSLMACFSLVVCYLFYETANSEETIFYNWLALGIIEVCMSWVCVIGLRGVHLLSFEMLLLYFWVSESCRHMGTYPNIACHHANCRDDGVWMFVAGLDFYYFLEIWFRHSWHTSMFSKVIAMACQLTLATSYLYLYTHPLLCMLSFLFTCGWYWLKLDDNYFVMLQFRGQFCESGTADEQCE